MMTLESLGNSLSGETPETLEMKVITRIQSKLHVVKTLTCHQTDHHAVAIGLFLQHVL
jgi:hypothetical protein